LHVSDRHSANIRRRDRPGNMPPPAMKMRRCVNRFIPLRCEARTIVAATVCPPQLEIRNERRSWESPDFAGWARVCCPHFKPPKAGGHHFPDVCKSHQGLRKTHTTSQQCVKRPLAYRGIESMLCAALFFAIRNRAQAPRIRIPTSKNEGRRKLDERGGHGCRKIDGRGADPKYLIAIRQQRDKSEEHS